MPPLKTKQQLAKEQKASNARERQIAKQYLQSGPSIQNLYNAFTHWYNSIPFLGGQPETGNVYITGTPPAVGIKNLEKVYKVAKVAGELNKAISKRVTGMQNNIQPVIRTKIGDVEINDPNLLYHLDNGDYRGWIDVDGAYIKDGMLYPGKTRAPGQLDYTWWNRGKPFINTKTKRLMTASPNNPSMLRIRDQNYPIGQWNGQSGFVQNSEYVSAEPIDVSESTYIWDANYGYRKQIPVIKSLFDL